MSEAAGQKPVVRDDPVPGGMVQFELAIVSRVGGRAVNEDACGHWHSDRHLCCVVADGAGGHGGGDVASRLVVSQLIEAFARQPDMASEALAGLLRTVNRFVRDHRADALAQRDMHSTVVALFVDLLEQKAMWAHVGDSRLYLFHDGAMIRRTRDHSTVQQLVDEGLLAEEGARAHPQRSELLCALGSDDADLLVAVSAAPWSVAPGDVFLLCTDGVWELVEDQTMAVSLTSAQGPDTWLQTLEACVATNGAQKPRHDNFSALTLWARGVD